MFSVNTSPEELENGSFPLKNAANVFCQHCARGTGKWKFHCKKRQQMFSVNTTPQELENGSFTLKNAANVFCQHCARGTGKWKIHSKKRSKCFLSTLRHRNWKMEVSL